MNLKERLERAVGVWEGSYLHLQPDGTLLGRHASRQETRIEGDRWYERIIYRWEDGREERRDFRARFSGEGLVMDDPDFHGETHLVGEDIVVFPYHWKSHPQVKIVETIVFAGDRRRSRVWQVIEQGKLARVTMISERRLPGAKPDIWE